MGKKTKSKQRLDAYYHYAKAQGYRSRAAYKLIQLNRKYNFLNNSTILIDLCAAPGGWMQVAKEFMPINSTIIGVDLDPIKRVPGTQSFQGDITTLTCYDTLKKMIKGQKCDVVLNDGAPNVGANWNKDAYTQSELVLHALKLACNFLKEGGFFITKVFRSTDFQSLMWVFKKFFEKVQATKPKASRFVSAEIFVVCSGYLAPEYIDQKLFDAKYIFKDTEADHFHDQMAGEITNIDKLLQNRRKRGGYQDNAPAHLYKQTSLTHFIRSKTPLLIFAQFNRITISPEQRLQFYPIIKNMPKDMDEMLSDLKVLGKRQVSSVMKWRSKIVHKENVQGQKAKSPKVKKTQHHDDDQIEQLSDHEDEIALEGRDQQIEEEHDGQQEGDQQQQQGQQQEAQEDEEMNSSAELQMQVLHQKKKEIRSIRQKQKKKQQDLIRAQVTNQQHHHDQQLGQDFEIDSDVELSQLGYDQEIYEEKPKKKQRVVVDYNAKQLQANLEQLYQARKVIVEEKQKQVREKRQAKKVRKQERYQNQEERLKSRKFGPKDMEDQENQEQENQNQKQNNKLQENEIQFNNPLAQLDDDDLYISQNEDGQADYKKIQKIDPNQKMEGELSDDDAYVIPKPMSQMERRRKQLKRSELKKQKKLQRSIVQGQDVGGQIQIVKQRKMEDYNVDSLAQTLAIAKKMLRAGSRNQIVQNSYRGYSFEDHDDLPKWFADDQKKHNYKKEPITKEQFNQQKERLMAINARIPKKIMEAKVRKKIRMQKKLKKVQKKAEDVMNQDGINEISKLRQVGKMYDKEKRGLKDNKKYVVSKGYSASKGKDTRNVKHVDSRLKKDKRSQKISKKRQLKRNHKRKGKF